MATADKYVNLSVNRILGVDRFGANLLDYLRAYDQDIVASVFANSGVFDALGLAADGTDKFKITGFTGNGIVGLDGAGNFLDLDARSADFETVQFENAGAVDYYVGLKGEVLPYGLGISPVDGLPHWDRMEEIAGWEGVPDSVVDNGDGTMTFKVNSVTESGPNRSGAGRQVAVYKKTIKKSAVTYAKALEICTVAWDAIDNKITTTTWAAGGGGVFGQDTPSTTASDYTVVLIGPRVSRNTDLSTVAAWCYVGFVTGAGAGNPPAVFDVTGQNLMNIPLSDLTQITRYENVPPNRLKIDVQALAAEEGAGIDQIRVSGWDGVGGPKTVFTVDELGNASVVGNLNIDGMVLAGDVRLSLATVYSINVAGECGTAANPWSVINGDKLVVDRIDLDEAAGHGFISNVLPDGDGTRDLGVWAWGVADTGYRWASLLATEMAAIKTSEPSVYLRKTGIAADEKTWRFLIDAGDDLVLETMDDTPASGISVLKVTRGAGTAVTQIDIYKPTYMGATLFTQTVSPVLQHTYYVGAYGGDEFLEVNAKDLVAAHDSPRFILRETDQIGTGVDRENWGIVATGGDLAIGAYDAARTSMAEAMHVYRAAGNSYAIDSIKFPAYIRSAAATATDPHTVIGLSGATFYHDLLSFEAGLGVNEGRWRFTTTDDGSGHFLFQTIEDTQVGGWNPVNILRVIRSAGTGIAKIESYTNFVPETDDQDDLGAIVPGNQRWRYGYFSKNVEAALLRASGDDGAGKAGFVTYTGTTSAINDVADGTIRLAIAANNSGWLKIRVAAGVGSDKYIPYFDAT